jgi:hypothetical protein
MLSIKKLNIDNDAMLEEFLLDDIDGIMKDISDTALREVIDSVQHNVYDVGVPVRYQRLNFEGGLIGSFTNNEISTRKREVAYEIKHDPTFLEYNPEEFQHGNASVDRVSKVANYIERGIGYDFPKDSESGIDDWWRQPREFWQPFLDNFNESIFQKSFLEGMRVRGMDNIFSGDSM